MAGLDGRYMLSDVTVTVGMLGYILYNLQWAVGGAKASQSCKSTVKAELR